MFKNLSDLLEMNNSKNLKIGIIGHGFVGKAIDWGFCTDVEKFIVDPKYSTSIDDLIKFSPKLCFVCVPTPMGKDGDQNSFILESVISELSQKIPKTLIVIKSTVLPNILEKLKETNDNLVYNPEFLREKHAKEDFQNASMLIFGGNKKLSQKVSTAYKKHSKAKTKKHVFLDLISASLVKYSINSFLAAKIIFFNEMHELFTLIGANDSWQDIIDSISIDERIGNSHMNVPGHDGREGFGGACFPKDTFALTSYASKKGVSLDVLKAAIKKNNSIRSKYKVATEREQQQNISFDKEL